MPIFDRTRTSQEIAAPAREAAASPSAAPIGQLLQRPEPLSFERHWRYGLLVSGRQYLFARDLGLVPVGLGEFAAAAQSYPLVFPQSLNYLPCAALGVSARHNLMVDSDGSWRPSRYLPALVRCYPFTLLPPSDGLTAPQLGIDMASPLVVLQHEHPSALPLYQSDGSRSELAQRAEALCRATYRDLTDAAAMAQALRARQLFVPHAVNLHFRDGATTALTDFARVDEAALAAVAPTFRERWQALGWLAALALQADSRRRWGELIALQDRRLRHALQSLRLKSE